MARIFKRKTKAMIKSLKQIKRKPLEQIKRKPLKQMVKKSSEQTTPEHYGKTLRKIMDRAKENAKEGDVRVFGARDWRYTPEGKWQILKESIGKNKDKNKSEEMNKRLRIRIRKNQGGKKDSDMTSGERAWQEVMRKKKLAADEAERTFKK